MSLYIYLAKIFITTWINSAVVVFLLPQNCPPQTGLVALGYHLIYVLSPTYATQ